MDIVNYTGDAGGGDDPATGPRASAEYRINICPLCDALNRSSSRGCSNCGWRSAFRGDAAGGLLAWLRLRSRTFLMYR